MPYTSNKPLLEILPESGYKDNDVVAALTEPVDRKYSDTLALMESMPDKLTANGCPEAMLDYLAYLVGMSGMYWDTGWSQSVKRGYIRYAAYLWRYKGTRQCIQRALDIHTLRYRLWVGNDIRFSVRIPATFGTTALKFYVRLPLAYGRTSYGYLEAQRVLNNYKPAVVAGSVCYESFSLGYSTLGEPVFK